MHVALLLLFTVLNTVQDTGIDMQHISIRVISAQSKFKHLLQYVII